MRLSAKTKYGVRALFDIAFHSQDAQGVAIQAKDIAKREHIPVRYLEQIFQDLRRAGIIESKRGPRGGYLLKRDATKLSLAEIVTVLEGPLSELFSMDDAGPEEPQPTSKKVTGALWQDLASVLSGWFSETTLADLVQRGNELGIKRDMGEAMYFI